MDADFRLPEGSWLHPSVVQAPSMIHGTGLFAAAQIPSGEIVESLGGTVVTDAEVLALIDGGVRYDGIALAPDRNLRIAPADWPGIYGNHSCDPNVWMRNDLTLVAKREIGMGEEVTVDYALFTVSPKWRMSCTCGSAFCRGEITGLDWKRGDLRERYRGHFATFIEGLIDQEA
ncbi:MAG: SET domain-containing protein-lysine N-methyltransferase [Actinomycetota bacterium]